jgi:hypothetical protein
MEADKCRAGGRIPFRGRGAPCRRELKLGPDVVDVKRLWLIRLPHCWFLGSIVTIAYALLLTLTVPTMFLSARARRHCRDGADRQGAQP